MKQAYDFELNGYTVKFYEYSDNRSYNVLNSNGEVVHSETRTRDEETGAYPFYMLEGDAREYVERITRMKARYQLYKNSKYNKKTGVHSIGDLWITFQAENKQEIFSKFVYSVIKSVLNVFDIGILTLLY
ncbi:MAG: hypothetical protein KAS32_29760 [Candidatus Peribacteraceae bacterium]|nr:hypothetical protein [Candidatus Peribacteraceae bacterium]